MIDYREAGKSGLIIQYEDLISMIGYNIAKLYRQNHLSKKLEDMDIKDVLLSYVERTEEDPFVWLRNEYDIDIKNTDEMLTSFLAMQPSLLYSYKFFAASNEEKMNNLIIYSDKYSPIAEETAKSYGINGVTYFHGNLEGLLKTYPNGTFITAATKSINICRDLKVPMCLVICDDFLYTMKFMVENKMEDILKKKGNIILRYTSALSAGLI